MSFNSDSLGDILFRYVDANNHYRLMIFKTPALYGLYVTENGYTTLLDSGYHDETAPIAVKIKLEGTSIKCWLDGDLDVNETDSTHAAGGVAIRAEPLSWDDLKIGYDVNDDDDIDDAGDNIVVDEDFGGTSCTVSHDHAGNLVDDGVYRYTYDAWNRLVKVESSTDSGAVTIQESEFDATGRRM